MFAPQHARECLAQYVSLVRTHRRRRDGAVELVRLATALLEQSVEVTERRPHLFGIHVRQPKAHNGRLPRLHPQFVVSGHFRAGLFGVYGAAVSMNNVIVDAVLDVLAGIGCSEDAFVVGLVFREQERHVSLDVQPAVAQRRGRSGDNARAGRRGFLTQFRLRPALPRPPGVAEPEGGEHVKRSSLAAAVRRTDPDEHVFRRSLGIFHEYIEIPVFVEHAGIEQLVLEVLPRPPAVSLPQIPIRKRPLRILVQVLHVRVRRRRVQVEVIFLDVFPVVALRIRKTEGTLFDDRVLAVPQGQSEAQVCLRVGESRKALFAPAVGI